MWPLPLLVATAFFALHIEGTVIHDACHKAAHPVPWINQAMGHGSAILLGFSFPVFTRVHLQHHIHVNHPKNCLLYTSPSPRDLSTSRMPSSA